MSGVFDTSASSQIGQVVADQEGREGTSHYARTTRTRREPGWPTNWKLNTGCGGLSWQTRAEADQRANFRGNLNLQQLILAGSGRLGAAKIRFSLLTNGGWGGVGRDLKWGKVDQNENQKSNQMYTLRWIKWESFWTFVPCSYFLSPVRSLICSQPLSPSRSSNQVFPLLQNSNPSYLFFSL